VRINRRTLLSPLIPIYGAAVSWKRRLFEAGRLKTKTLKHPVISVGSVSAGGAGKTPFVLLLADVLERRRYAVRILTRGYRRGSSEVERVEPWGDARRYGDEPMLLAQKSGAPVYVGADRYKAGLMAEGEPSERRVVHLLDDGFQHRRLSRDLDIVLLTRSDLTDMLLPAGDLREPLSTLAKADVIVLREEEAEALHGFVSGLVRESEPQPIWQIRRRLKLPTSGGGKLPGRVMAFCGIARPEGFFGMLEAEAWSVAGTVVFGDHHRYEEGSISKLIERAVEVGADSFVTTEKDAVKLTEGMRRRMEEVGPVMVAELWVELVDEKAALEQIISMVPRLNRRRTR